jgi:hypothetical protein
MTRWAPWRSEIWSLEIPWREWDLFCRWIAAGVLYALIRPLSFYLRNPLDEPPLWDPIRLLAWVPEPSLLTLKFCFALTVAAGCAVLVFGGRRSALAALAITGVTFLSLQHGLKYLHHRDALLALTLIVLPLYPARPGRNVSSEPAVFLCAMWSLAFVSAAFSKWLSPDGVLNDPAWLRGSMSLLEASGRSLNMSFAFWLERVYEWSPRALVGLNYLISFLELSVGAFFITGSLWGGIAGVLLLCAFQMCLGIGFIELAWIFPAWLLVHRMRRAAH